MKGFVKITVEGIMIEKFRFQKNSQRENWFEVTTFVII
jgi:hypothetical protein